MRVSCIAADRGSLRRAAQRELLDAVAHLQRFDAGMQQNPQRSLANTKRPSLPSSSQGQTATRSALPFATKAGIWL